MNEHIDLLRTIRRCANRELAQLPRQFAGTVLCRDCWTGLSPICERCRPVVEKQQSLIRLLDTLDEVQS